LQTLAQLLEGDAVARQHAGNHAIDSSGTLLLRFGFRRHLAQRVELADPGEGVVEDVEKAAFDVLALQAQVAHGLEVEVLVEPVHRPIGHFEQRIVGIVEQRLQALTHLQRGLVTHLQEQHREARQRRASAPIDGGREGHHLAFFLHPGLLAG